jgi:predicted SAM-dependent methyltransferase
MRKITPRRTPDGFCYLNVGCGDHFSPDWNNLDLVSMPGVVYHDIRKPLPYPDACLDAAYSSHVLEHLRPDEGLRLLQEFYRLLKPGGIVRVVVPDLEAICREYLKCLESVTSNPTDANTKRYKWITLELIDQMVREKPGGLMAETIDKNDYDPEYLEGRSGDSFIKCRASRELSDFDKWNMLKDKPLAERARIVLDALKRRVERKLNVSKSPRQTGEAHRWMYDRFSLKMALEKAGFVDYRVTTYDRSLIPLWEKYNLDRSIYREASRKPGSLYTEAVKPIP